jgi:hypothetical protein
MQPFSGQVLPNFPEGDDLPGSVVPAQHVYAAPVPAQH